MVVANLSDGPPVAEDWERLEADLYFAPHLRTGQLEMVVQSPSFAPESVRPQPEKGAYALYTGKLMWESSFAGAGRAWGGNPEVSNSRKLEEQREVVGGTEPRNQGSLEKVRITRGPSGRS